MMKRAFIYGSIVTLVVGFLKIYFSSLIYSVKGNLEFAGLYFALSGFVSASSSLAGWSPNEVILKYQRFGNLQFEKFKKILKVLVLAVFGTIIMTLVFVNYLMLDTQHIANQGVLLIVISLVIAFEYLWSLFVPFATISNLHKTIFTRKLLISAMPILGCFIYRDNLTITSLITTVLLGSISFNIYYLVVHFNTIKVFSEVDTSSDKDFHKDIAMGYLTGIAKAASNKSENVILPLVLGAELFGQMYTLTSIYGIVLAVSSPVKQVLSKDMFGKGKTRLMNKRILEINFALSCLMLFAFLGLKIIVGINLLDSIFSFKSISYALSNWKLTDNIVLPLLVLSKGLRWFVRPVSFYHDSFHSLKVNVVHGLLLVAVFFLTSDPSKFIMTLLILELTITIYWHLWLKRK